jgi:hypothetical protein
MIETRLELMDLSQSDINIKEKACDQTLES